MNNQFEWASDADLLEMIDGFSSVQKTNPFGSVEWMRAEKQLKPLFEEMAKRTGK